MPRQPATSNVQGDVFYGDDIFALQDLDPNETYVIIGQCCATLGIDRAAQERRIRAHAVLSTGARKMTVEDEDGNGSTQAWCLRVDLLPLWFAGIDASQVREDVRPRLEQYQRETASVLWQVFRPQGFSTEDTLLSNRHEQSAAEQAYVAAESMATLARHQFLLERQLGNARANRHEQGNDPWSPPPVEDTSAARLAQTVRRVAVTLAERSRRNEYGGVFSGLYRQFGISSYRRMPAGRLHEALEWLERWHGDLLGEPEPPPDI